MLAVAPSLAYFTYHTQHICTFLRHAPVTTSPPSTGPESSHTYVCCTIVIISLWHHYVECITSSAGVPYQPCSSHSSPSLVSPAPSDSTPAQSASATASSLTHTSSPPGGQANAPYPSESIFTSGCGLDLDVVKLKYALYVTPAFSCPPRKFVHIRASSRLGAGAAIRTEPTFMRIVCTGGTGPECVPAALEEVEAPRGRAVSMGTQRMIMTRADADERRGEIRRNRSVRFRMTRLIAGPGRTFTRTFKAQ